MDGGVKIWKMMMVYDGRGVKNGRKIDDVINGRPPIVVYNLRIEKMCTIFAKKSFEDRKNVPASSKGAALGRATA